MSNPRYRVIGKELPSLDSESGPKRVWVDDSQIHPDHIIIDSDWSHIHRNEVISLRDWLTEWLDHDPDAELRIRVNILRESLNRSADDIIAAVREHDRRNG
jgi:hypothetical protein